MRDPHLDEALVASVLAPCMEGIAPILWPQPAVEVLYHYTNATGMMAILGAGRLWATHHAYLNDPAEGVYVSTLLRTLFGEEAEGHPPGTTSQSKERLRTNVMQYLASGRHVSSRYAPYVASFSEYADELGQWRAYGGNGEGYAIGMRFGEILGTALEGAERHKLRLMKVTYEEATQRKVLLEVVETALEILVPRYLAARDEDERRTVWNSVMIALLRVVGTLSAAFKHPAYASEAEWRLAADLINLEDALSDKAGREDPDYRAMYIEPVKLRPRKGLPTPYIEVALNDAPESPVFTGVTVGPRLDPALAKGPIQLLLSRRGYKVDLPVLGSRVPYRG